MHFIALAVETNLEGIIVALRIALNSYRSL